MNEAGREILKRRIESARAEFEMKVEQACLETTEIAKQLSKAIGDTSIDEVTDAIIGYFTERMRAKSYFAEFQGKR